MAGRHGSRDRHRHRRRAALAAVTGSLALLATACAAAEPSSQRTEPAAPAAGSSAADASSVAATLPEEAGHVHGAALTDDGTVLVATHHGLMVVADGKASRVGPPVDLMGFTTSVDDSGRMTLLASGHAYDVPGLTDPVGLIESTDSGRTWRVVSRAGESDFHALAAVAAGAVGLDGGRVLVSADRREWRTAEIDQPPRSLAADPGGRVVLATTAQGPRRSTDGGATFAPVPSAPLLVHVAHDGEDGFLGVGTDGTVHRGDATGTRWERVSSLPDIPAALAARGDRVAVVVGSAVLVSTDGGRTFGAG